MADATVGTKPPNQARSCCPGFGVQVGKGRESSLEQMGARGQGYWQASGAEHEKGVRRNGAKRNSIHRGRTCSGMPGSASLGDSSTS